MGFIRHKFFNQQSSLNHVIRLIISKLGMEYLWANKKWHHALNYRCGGVKCELSMSDLPRK